MNREALAAALERISLAAALERISRRELAPFDDDMLLVARAASKRLAQLPEKCAICNGDGFITYGDDGNARDCEVCHGSGKVYPPELVERMVSAVAGRATMENGYLIAVAVLDALNGETP